MTVLVDVVNFNADASCLDSRAWIDALAGGTGSRFCQWLLSYANRCRPVVLGLMGATLVDVAHWNPEALDIINGHREVFGVILRPFSHDVSPLRTPQGFLANLRHGRAALGALEALQPWFLPPEFMLTNQQVTLLAGNGVNGVFINAGRYHPDLRGQIPRNPYLLTGTLGQRLRCIPVQGELTNAYLESLHRCDAVVWNAALGRTQDPVVFSWRDGESVLLLPDGIVREQLWLADESVRVERRLLGDVSSALVFEAGTTSAAHHYPAHSFHAWSREMRMLGFLQRIHDQELRIDTFSIEKLALWLQVINSDVLSSVEKDSPVVTLHALPGAAPGTWKHTILRCARGFEGEEFLGILEDPVAGADYLAQGGGAHMEKLRVRMKALATLGGVS
jgi:hypothetical protein